MFSSWFQDGSPVLTDESSQPSGVSLLHHYFADDTNPDSSSQRFAIEDANNIKALDKACPTESDVYTCQLTSGCVSWRHHRFAAEANCERRLADAVQTSWHPLQSRPTQHATKWLPWRQRCTSDNNNNEKRNLQRQHSLEPHSLESLAPVCYVKLWPRYTPHTWVMWHELGSVMWLYDVYVQMM